MSKERYLQQEINKDLKILALERQLEEVQKENTQLKEMREHLKWKDETRKEKERLERQLEEANKYLIQASEADWTEDLNDHVRKLKEQG